MTSSNNPATSIGQLVPESYDAVTLELTSATVETFKFRVGGSTGPILATVTVTYTDSTKETISSVVRT